MTVLLSSMFLVFSCGDDDENSLTSPTTNGKGTMSFLLDGKVWRPKTKFYIPVTPASHGMEISVIQYDSNNYNRANELILISIGAQNYDNNQLISFKIDSVLHEGQYLLKEAEFISDYNNRYNILGVDLNSNFVNISKIHRDYKPHVEGERLWGGYTMDSYVSGTFEMTLKNLDGDSVIITNGRFDLMNRSYTIY
jgi:hypothetical protein